MENSTTELRFVKDTELLHNYVYPSFKFISKKRVGSRYKKVYDIPKSPAR